MTSWHTTFNDGYRKQFIEIFIAQSYVCIVREWFISDASAMRNRPLRAHRIQGGQFEGPQLQLDFSFRGHLCHCNALNERNYLA